MSTRYPVTIITTIREPLERHDVADSLFRADGAPWLQITLFKPNRRFQHETHRDWTAVKRVFKWLRQRTSYVAIIFVPAQLTIG